MPGAVENLAFVWDNFGPPHIDRCEATARYLQSRFAVIGVEIFRRSETYGWAPAGNTEFHKETLFETRRPGQLAVFIKVVRYLVSIKARHIFLCHYQEPYILSTALVLRLLGKKVYVMGDSKFDDYSRQVGRECLKSFYLLPYVGALTASRRSLDYLRFLGWRKKPIEIGYDTISTERVRRLANSTPAPEGVAYSERHFTIVARHVPKKNIGMALQAFADHCSRQTRGSARKLVLCGSGPLENELKEQAARLSISHLVEFRGFLQAADVCAILSRTLCLILPSVEEQFGQVVPEALAMGVPVVLSTNCGARDELVRSGVNGFVIEPDNVEGLSAFLSILSNEEALWAAMARNTQQFVALGDVKRFAEAVEKLIGRERCAALSS